MRSNRIENSIRFGAWSTETFGRFGPRFSIQFSISSPVIVRNRRIEPKFGLLNLSTVNFGAVWLRIARGREGQNCKMNNGGTCRKHQLGEAARPWIADLLVDCLANLQVPYMYW